MKRPIPNGGGTTMKYRILMQSLLLISLVSIGCKHLEQDIDPDKITDAESLVAFLSEEKIMLLHHGPLISMEMGTTAHAFTPMSGGLLHVYKYPTAADAFASSSWLEYGRDIRRSPNVYRKEELVVIFWGRDPRLETALFRVFGLPTG